jgi:WD40 repeat protein
MADRVGQQLGNYRLLRLIGQGGFGEVYLGEHVYLQRPAAIKVLSVRLEKEDMEGFLNEARTIARLEHPNIVQVLEFGVENGIPFLVMSYAPNGTLRQRHPRGTTLPIPAIVSYIKQVAHALQYAHDEKLIHRDVKPENMLLGRRNEVLLSDFGIALIAQSTSAQSKQEVVGTVTYMAPEQIQGKPRPASDQYALGVVVYEWLSGDRPFHGSFTEIATQHLFVPPPPLSSKTPKISPDIEQVVMTALAKDPQQRFKNVRAFATALEQACLSAQDSPIAQESQPLLPTVAAIPPSQHIWPAVAIPSESQISQPGVMNTSPIELQRTERGISRRAALVGLGGLAVVGIAGSITWLALSHPSSNPSGTSTSSVPPMHTATSESTSIPSSTPTSSPLGTTLYNYHGHNAGMRALAWSPDSKRVATASDDYTAQVWDATTGDHAVIYRGHSSYVEGVSWSPDGKQIVSGSADTTVQIWDSATGNLIYTYHGHNLWVNRVSWSSDGKYIVSGEQSSTPGRVVEVHVWEASTGKTIVTYTGHTNGVYAVAWSPDGNHIASAGYDGTLQVWEASTGKPTASYHGSAFLFGLSWSPDNKYVAIGSSDNTVLLVDAMSGSVFATYSGHTNWVKDVAWSPDGKYIASGSDDGMVLLWNTATGTNFYTYNGHSGHINAVGWASNDRLVASGGDTVQVWQAV